MKLEGSYAPALLGRRLCDKWRLVRVLGSGGMSTVFEGLHRNGKRVAIKVLHPELAVNPRMRSRFKREAYVANQVDHPDAVSVIDDDTSEEGLAFLVMELLDGETLGARLKRRGAPFPVAEVLAAALSVLDVLAVAHRVGVIHRDVKPDNIFLARGARSIKLLDFGIASLREISAGGSELTGAGATLGTPAFMAPEQARGRIDEVDATTDLWGLGATMFTLLSARFVHEGVNGNELLIAAATCSAPPLASVVDGLPAGLVAIVDRALAFERSARWPDAASMRSALCALNLHGAGEVFGDDGSVPLAYEQSTCDESKAPEDSLPMLGGSGEQQRSRSSGVTRKARLSFGLLAAPALLIAIEGWRSRPPETHRHLATGVESRIEAVAAPSTARSEPWRAARDFRDPPGAIGSPDRAASVRAPPQLPRIGEDKKRRPAAMRAIVRPTANTGGVPREPGVPVVAVIDPLDRR